jgi:hypothetical protein
MTHADASWLTEAMATMPAADAEAAAAVAERAAQILRPAGALARLDAVAEWAAAWQGTPTPAVTKPAAIIFAADHGVAASGEVSAYPIAVTAAMLSAFRAGRSTVNAFARLAGASVDAIDVGVGAPTGDIRTEPAHGGNFKGRLWPQKPCRPVRGARPRQAHRNKQYIRRNREKAAFCKRGCGQRLAGMARCGIGQRPVI